MKGGKNAKYMKTVYFDIETGEVLNKDFKENYYYEFKNIYYDKEKIKNTEFIYTTRGVKLKGRKPKQIQIAF